MPARPAMQPPLTSRLRGFAWALAVFFGLFLAVGVAHPFLHADEGHGEQCAMADAITTPSALPPAVIVALTTAPVADAVRYPEQTLLSRTPWGHCRDRGPPAALSAAC